MTKRKNRSTNQRIEDVAAWMRAKYTQRKDEKRRLRGKVAGAALREKLALLSMLTSTKADRQNMALAYGRAKRQLSSARRTLSAFQIEKSLAVKT